LLLGVDGDGIFSWRIGDDRANLDITLSEGTASTFQGYGRVGGASSGGTAFAGGLFGVYLKTEAGIAPLKPVEIVGDLDRRGNLTAAVGLSRKDGGYRRGAMEDHVAWLFEDGQEEPVKLLPTRDEGQRMGRCWESQTYVIRFIADDRVLIVPDGEPGVFVYDTSGELVESLDSFDFTADAGCALTEEQSLLMGEAAYRLALLGKRRLVDEVVADDAGNVYFFVRHLPDGLNATVSAGAAAAVLSSSAAATSEGRSLPDGSGIGPVRLTGEDAKRFLEAAGSDVQTRLVEREDASGNKVVTRVTTFNVGARPDPPASAPAYDRENPPRARVCWDLVHVRADDLTAVTTLLCAFESEFADARLRADLRGDRAVVLVRGFEGLWSRRAQAFEVRLQRPAAP